MPADGKVGVSPASNGSPRAAPSAAALAIIRQTPNLFERLAALNKRLEAQTERLEEVARPSTGSLFRRAAALGAFSAKPDSESASATWVQPPQTPSESPSSLSAPSESPSSLSAPAANSPPPQPKMLRPSTAPSTAPPSRLIRSLLSAQGGSSTPWQDTDEYRSWTHNTNYFRDGRRLWLEFVADIALFTAARAAVLDGGSNRSGGSSGGGAGSGGGGCARQVRVWSCGCSSGEELYTCRMAYEQWVAPTFAQAFGSAPRFHGVGTDRSGTIIEAARDERSEWSEAALSNVPPEMLRTWFHEVVEPAHEREARLKEAMMSGYSIPPKRRFTLPPAGRRDCEWRVEDTGDGGGGDGGGDGDGGGGAGSSLAFDDKYDLILCRYSIFLYAADESDARRALGRIVSRLAPHGMVILGATDALPPFASQLLEPVPVDEILAAASAALKPDGAKERRPSPTLLATPEKRLPIANAWRLKSPQGAAADGAAAALPASSGTSGAGASSRASVGPAAPAAVLRAALSLQHLRLGLLQKPQFFEPEAKPAPLCWTSERSSALLRGNALFEISVTERAAQYEAKRQQKLVALRVEREQAEMAEIQNARAALMGRLAVGGGRPRATTAQPLARLGLTSPTWLAGQPWRSVQNERPTTVPNLHSPATGGVGRRSRSNALSNSPYGQLPSRSSAPAVAHPAKVRPKLPARDHSPHKRTRSSSCATAARTAERGWH